MTQQLLDAQRVLRLAEEQFLATLRQLYPVGASVRWSYGAHQQFGTVVRHGYRDRVFVHNSRTDRELWITAAHICEAARRSKGVA